MGRLGLGEGGEGQGKWLAEGQTSLCFWCGLPLGFGSCIAPQLLIGQLTLLYPLFLSFRSNGEAVVCGYIKLPGIIPGRREANEVLANKDSGIGGEGGEECVRKSESVWAISALERPEGTESG